MRQPVHGPAYGDQARAHLDLREDGTLKTCEPDITRQGELRAAAPRSAAHGRDRHRRQARQSIDDVGPGEMSVRLARNEILETGGGTEVSNEEIGIGAVEHDHLELGLSFGEIEQMLELWDRIVIEQVDRRVVEGDAPIGGASTGQVQLIRRFTHVVLQSRGFQALSLASSARAALTSSSFVRACPLRPHPPAIASTRITQVRSGSVESPAARAASSVSC